MTQVLAYVWLALLLVGQPAAAILGGGRAVERPAVPRLRQYLGSAVGIAVIGGISVVLSLVTTGDAVAAVTAPLSPRVLGWAGATVAVSALLWLATQYVRKRHGGVPDVYRRMLPRTATEKLAFAGVAALAGSGEELAYRGFCLFQIQRLTGSMGVAVVVTTLAFGLGHAYQGIRGAARTTLIGALLVVPVLVTGSLVPSMLGHFTLDLATGLWGDRLLRAWGVIAEV